MRTTRWYRAGSRLELCGPYWLVAQLRNFLAEAYFGEACGDARTQRLARGVDGPHGVAQNLADFLFCAPTMLAGQPLQFGFGVVVELPYEYLGHTEC